VGLTLPLPEEPAATLKNSVMVKVAVRVRSFSIINESGFSVEKTSPFSSSQLTNLKQSLGIAVRMIFMP